MKKLFLIPILMLVFCLPLNGQDAPKLAAAEYNIGSCGSSDYTVRHAVVKNDKDGQHFVFTYYMDTPATVSEDDYSTDIKSVAVNKDGVTKFIAIRKEHPGSEFTGFIKGKNIIAILTVNNGDLGHIFYGQEGKVDNMIVYFHAYGMRCEGFRNMNPEVIPDILIKYLDNMDGSKDNN